MAPTLILTAEQIARGVRAVAEWVDREYPEGEIPLICLDYAACTFSSDLADALAGPGRSSRITHIRPKDRSTFPEQGFSDFNLIVDTLFDTGKTFERIADIPGMRVTLCVKDDVEPRHAPFPDWWALHVPYTYIYGYGLDDDDGGARELPEIWTAEQLPPGLVGKPREGLEGII